MSDYQGTHRRTSALAQVDGFIRDLDVEIAEDAGQPEPYTGKHRDNSAGALAYSLIGSGR